MVLSTPLGFPCITFSAMNAYFFTSSATSDGIARRPSCLIEEGMAASELSRLRTGSVREVRLAKMSGVGCRGSDRKRRPSGARPTN
jgi:hypothetical protein